LERGTVAAAPPDRADAGGIAIAYDVGQGQGWQRSIVTNGRPHLRQHRQWFGDSRGHWEGDTLVIDVTNFSPKTDYRGSRENLHLASAGADQSTTLELSRSLKIRPCGRVLDRPPRVHKAERGAEQDLLRASLRRRNMGFDDGRAPSSKPMFPSTQRGS